VADLRIDMAALDRLYKDLLSVSIRFSDIESTTRGVGDAVGHEGLAGRVQSFSSDWKIRREEMIQGLDAVWRSAKAIHSTFVEVDGLMAENVR